jgi:hypothetical protein
VTVLRILSTDDLAVAFVEQHADVNEWLAANGINPHVVSAATPVTVEDEGGQRYIRYGELVLDGSVRPGSRTIERTVPLTAEPPDSIPAPGAKPGGWNLAGSFPGRVGRRFRLVRDRDITGVSGEGVVADGTQFDEPFSLPLPDGTTIDLPAGWCLVQWRGEHRSSVFWERFESAERVHGHGGATRFVWLD